jgi:anthranilate synthase component 1
VLAIDHVRIDEHESVDAAYEAGCRELDEFVRRFEAEPMPLRVGEVELDMPPSPPAISNMTREQFERIVERAREYISAGDIFQVVLSQRFERSTEADPFDIYRALRIVNPSPYMFYLQAAGCMLVGSSPEILCRVHEGQVVNRPLAGTRRRGRTLAEDRAMEAELLADPKERAEHVMLVDLGRNDVGRVCRPGSVQLPAVMVIERYSHVMHISSTVTGALDVSRDCWDVLRASLPVGTVSGAPKVRAMQIIDELEPTRRGPYAGAVGYTDFAGNMDTAIALRTMVVMPDDQPGRWKVHLQAGAGIVADSVASLEYQETVNKAAALAKAIDLAETAFSDPSTSAT